MTLEVGKNGEQEVLARPLSRAENGSSSRFRPGSSGAGPNARRRSGRPTGTRTPTNGTKIRCATITPWASRRGKGRGGKQGRNFPSSPERRRDEGRGAACGGRSGGREVGKSGCREVGMSGCQDVGMSGCQDVGMSGCQDVRRSGGGMASAPANCQLRRRRRDVGMSGCQEVRMSGGGMSGCQEVGRWDGKRSCQLPTPPQAAGCRDVRMSGGQDVGRWDVGMSGWQALLPPANSAAGGLLPTASCLLPPANSAAGGLLPPANSAAGGGDGRLSRRRV
jgi:hypothetical protein